MRRKSAKLLEDIRDATEFILGLTRDNTLASYRADRMVRQTVERNFEIIGEALGRLARDDKATASRVGDYTRIIGFRNVLIHGYDLIDHAEVWRVIRENLPVLADEVSGLLKEPVDPT